MQLQLTIFFVPGGAIRAITSETWYWLERVLAVQWVTSHIRPCRPGYDPRTNSTRGGARDGMGGAGLQDLHLAT